MNGRTKHRNQPTSSAQIWARAAHDLRQPVQALLLLTQVLDHASSRAEQKRTVRQIETALLSLHDMLEVLALMARIEAGLQVVPLRTCSLGDILGPVAKEMAGIAEARRVGLRCRRTRALVRSHPKLLAMAIRSLFLNAIELGSGGDIVAGCRRRGGDIAFEVSFSGGSLDAARRRGAFVPLSPREGQTVAGGLGLGLGLLEHLCRHLGHDFQSARASADRQVLAIALPLVTAAR